MRRLRLIFFMAMAAVGLGGCAVEGAYPPAYVVYPGDPLYSFYCPANPYAGFDCPGSFYYNHLFFADSFAFFTYYHIDRAHWGDFHGRRSWDGHDRDHPGSVENGARPASGKATVEAVHPAGTPLQAPAPHPARPGRDATGGPGVKATSWPARRGRYPYGNRSRAASRRNGQR